MASKTNPPGWYKSNQTFNGRSTPPTTHAKAGIGAVRLPSGAAGSSRPHLSTSVPHGHVEPPHSCCRKDWGFRFLGIGVLQRGQETGHKLIPHLFFAIVPYTINAVPVPKRTNSTAKNIIAGLPFPYSQSVCNLLFFVHSSSLAND
jgi:hypothetical protein